MAMALIMFIKITHKLHTLIFCKFFVIQSAWCMVSDVWGVRRIGHRTYIFNISPTPQLLVNYCIINKKNYLFVQTNKINIISQLVKSCNHPNISRG